VVSANDDPALMNEFQLLTTKPVIYVCNVEEKSALTGNAYVENVKAAVANENAEVIFVTAAIEAEIASLETPEEREMFLKDMGLDEPGVNKLIRAAYHLLKLQTYFTAGVQEVRAWTIHQGDTGPKAAGRDPQRLREGLHPRRGDGYDDFITLGSEAACTGGRPSACGRQGVRGEGRRRDALPLQRLIAKAIQPVRVSFPSAHTSKVLS
jgi:ribosome-binding ATPase YchF (GTP1/OBG family)